MKMKEKSPPGGGMVSELGQVHFRGERMGSQTPKKTYYYKNIGRQ